LMQRRDSAGGDRDGGLGDARGGYGGGRGGFGGRGFGRGGRGGRGTDMTDEQRERMRQTMDLAYRPPATLTIVASDSGLTFTSDIFFSSRRRHTRLQGDWSSDVCSSD